MSARLDWATPGAECATVYSRGYSGNLAPLIRNARVARVTKAHVVLESGQRFMLASGKRVGEQPSEYGGGRTRLYPEGHPDLVLARQQAERIRLRRVSQDLMTAGLGLLDVRAVALHALATGGADLVERAQRLIRTVGGADAPSLDVPR